MRVTENTNFNIIRDTMERSRERMENLQLQSSTLRKINTPSDDPISAAKVLELRTAKQNNDQYQVNSKLAETFLNNTDQGLADLAEIMIRAKEIAIGQSSVVSSSEETRVSVSEEVAQLFQQAVSIANRKIGDRYLFGGFKTQSPPVDLQGQYLGDDGQMMVEIANDVFISMNIPGFEIFNTHPSQAPQNPTGYGEPSREGQNEPENVNLFDVLQNFRIALLTGDMYGIHGSLDPLDQVLGKLVATRAKIGARVQGLAYNEQAIERHNITNSILSSNLEDADMAQVVSDLGKEETVFRSSLASAKRLIQPTLLDFLK